MCNYSGYSVLLVHLYVVTDPEKIASSLKNMMSGIGSAIAGGVGLFLCIWGIQGLASAREGHDISAQMQNIAKFLGGAFCLFAFPIAKWINSTMNTGRGNPADIADNVSGMVTYIGSSFAGAIGLYVLIAGIQEFAQAREAHDTSTQIKAAARIMGGVLAVLAGGIAVWLKKHSNTNGGDAGTIADNVSGVVTYVGSAIAGGVGLYVLIAGIQEFVFAREAHDTSTQMKAVSKIMGGVLAALAGGIAVWMKAKAG